MKKLYFIPCVAIAVALGACSGSEKPENKEGSRSFEFETYSYDAISEFINPDSLDAPGAKYWRSAGNGVLPVRIGDADIKQLRDSLMSMGKVEFATREAATPTISTDRRLTDLDPAVTEACSESSNQLTIDLMTSQVIVWKDLSSFYLCQSAHGMYSTTFVNYSLADNKILSLKDLMVPGYEERLIPLLQAKLKENPDVMEDVRTIKVPEQFRITSDGIDFVYPLYDVAPYSAGEIYVDFEIYELDGLLTPKAVKLIAGPQVSD